jgi:hypothetical protein
MRPDASPVPASVAVPGWTDFLDGLRDVDLAKQNPEKLAKLRALFEQQAEEHHLYPLITWDDVFKGRIHHSKDN